MEVLCPSFSTSESWPAIRQEACRSAIFWKQSVLSLMVRLRARRGETVFRRSGSAVGSCLRTAATKASRRPRSREAWLRSWDARTKAPGRPRTAPMSVPKSPPVCGARKTTTCCASFGTVILSPPWPFRVQVSAL